MASLQTKLRLNFYRRGTLKKGPLWALGNAPNRRGTCLKITDQTPRKPNSALRTVSWVVLSNKNRVFVYVCGQGHNLQKHSSILVRGGRTKDLPGLKYKAVRGWGDFCGLPNRRHACSKYGTRTTPNRVSESFYKFVLWN